MNIAVPSPTSARQALYAPARAAEAFAPRESNALLALLDSVEQAPLARLLATAAAIRMRLLEADSDEAAGLWDDLLVASHGLRGQLLDGLRVASGAAQERVLAYLRELAATGSPAFAPLRPPLAVPELVVAAAGDFKRGKSTLLNALLGMRLLPTRVAPATAVPCFVRYAPALTIRVLYRDGRDPVEIPPEDLERYACIAHPGDDEDELAFRPEIARLEIGLPWSLPRDVTLVDLPGLNEEGGRSELARATVAEADAVLVVLAATQLLAEDELQFVETLWAEGHRALLFAVNHLDQLEGSDLALVQERAATLLAPYGGILGQSIFLVSARQAINARAAGDPAPLESGMPLLEARLHALLAGERAAVWRAARTRQALGRLEAAEEATGNATLDRQEAVRRLREELAALDEQLAAAERGYTEGEAATAHDLTMARQRLEDHDRRFDERWKALEGDLRERCRREPLPWVWQQAREWLREEMVRAIREVNPQVMPRPEGYLRISVAPGLRLGRDALFAFYRDEAKREWERFIGEARQQGREALEEALTRTERERQELVASREALAAPLEARRAALEEAVEAAGGEMRRELEEALTAAEALRAALEAFAI